MNGKMDASDANLASAEGASNGNGVLSVRKSASGQVYCSTDTTVTGFGVQRQDLSSTVVRCSSYSAADPRLVGVMEPFSFL